MTKALQGLQGSLTSPSSFYKCRSLTCTETVSAPASQEPKLEELGGAEAQGLSSGTEPSGFPPSLRQVSKCHVSSPDEGLQVLSTCLDLPFALNSQQGMDTCYLPSLASETRLPTELFGQQTHVRCTVPGSRGFRQGPCPHRAYTPGK